MGASYINRVSNTERISNQSYWIIRTTVLEISAFKQTNQQTNELFNIHPKLCNESANMSTQHKQYTNTTFCLDTLTVGASRLVIGNDNENPQCFHIYISTTQNYIRKSNEHSPIWQFYWNKSSFMIPIHDAVCKANLFQQITSYFLF